MLEEVKTVVTILSTILIPFLLWILSSISTSLKDIAKDLNDLKVKLAGEYVTKEECFRLHAEFERTHEASKKSVR